MIIYERGDLFSKMNNVDAVINTVNCVGVMGKGIALKFKELFPENFIIYKKKCLSNELTIGNSFIYSINSSNKTKFIINFPTKLHWRNPSKLEYIEEGLDNLVSLIKEHNIKSIAMPALGCGNGNLDWDIVKPLIEKKLYNLKDVTIFVYEPSLDSSIEKKQSQQKRKPRLTQFRKELLLLMQHYNTASKETLINYIQIQIISYFLSFDDDKMKFELKENGPFLEDINKVILLLSQFYIEPVKENNKLTKIKVLNTNFPQKKEVQLNHNYILVKSLISGFESDTALLTLSLVHWFKLNMKTDDSKVKTSVFTWLTENHYSPDISLIDKSIVRLDKIYFKPKNLSFDFS